MKFYALVFYFMTVAFRCKSNVVIIIVNQNTTFLIQKLFLLFAFDFVCELVSVAKLRLIHDIQRWPEQLIRFKNK
jgi:hypothetical protein